MLTLDDALALLDEDEVDEVVVQSGQTVRALKGFAERSIPGEPLTASEIVGILQAAHLQDIVPRHDTAGEEHAVSIEGRDYHVRIARFLDLIEVRISFEDASPTDVEGDDATPVTDATDATVETVIVTAPKRPRPRRHGGVERRARSPGPGERHDGAEPPANDPTPGPQPKPADAEPDSAPACDTPASDPETAQVEPSAVPGGTAAMPAINATTPIVSAASAPAVPSAQIYEDDQARLDPAIAATIAVARTAGASDVHFISDEPPRTRVGGRLEPQGAPVSGAKLAAAVQGLLAPHHTRILGDLGYVDLGTSDPRAGRLRINVCRHRAGLKMCVRLVAAAPNTPTELGLPWEVEAVANHHQGLVVCSGPSGAGKTTTMAALVNLFNERKAVHIITVEDPVEIKLGRGKAIVSQREIGTHTLSFGSALKAALREDPDIIAIGELRDRETVEMALSASETGHLVLATMSTPSGTQTISRLIDLFPPDDQSQVRATLAGALKLVVSQRLVETTDGDRQVAAFEVITGNVPLWSLIRDQKLHQLPSLLQRGRAYGMVRLEDSLRGLILSKTITRTAAMAFADDPKLLGGDEGSPPASRRARAGRR